MSEIEVSEKAKDMTKGIKVKQKKHPSIKKRKLLIIIKEYLAFLYIFFKLF